jgi:ABC-type Zn2+ transport system substrate-binding protein/surface adhesin
LLACDIEKTSDDNHDHSRHERENDPHGHHQTSPKCAVEQGIALAAVARRETQSHADQLGGEARFRCDTSPAERRIANRSGDIRERIGGARTRS